MQHNKLLLKEIQSCPSYYSGNNRKSNIWLQTEPYLTWLDAWQSSEAPWQGCFALSCPVCLLLTLWPGILLNCYYTWTGGGKGAAVDINSGKNGKVKVRGKLGSLSINFTLGHPADIKQQRHITCAPSHIQAYTQRNVCMQTHNIHRLALFSPQPPHFFWLSLTHTCWEAAW